MKKDQFVNLTSDERAQLGWAIGGALVGVSEPTWVAWVAVVERDGLKRAVAFARTAAESPSVPAAVRQAARQALRVVRKWPILRRLPQDELIEVLHYARWALVARRAMIWAEED